MALNPRMSDWRARRVWLVGASTGIGRALRPALHAQGAQVIVSARQAAALNAFVLEHPGAQALALDATDAKGRPASGQHRCLPKARWTAWCTAPATTAP
jgi:NADP-dependent 3-hydroxy acid dehydrogenase YdfG